MPFLPVNKGGGSGAEALRYLQDNSGNPHIIMATLNSYFTTPVQTDIGVDIEEFTPLARMAVDTFALWVNADSGIETLEDYVEAVRAADGAFRMGGTGTGQEDSLVTALLEQAFGIRHTYVPMGGGGDVATALVGGHVERDREQPLRGDELLAGRPRAPDRALHGRARSTHARRADLCRARPPARILHAAQLRRAGPTCPEAAQAYYIELFTRCTNPRSGRPMPRSRRC
jgi:putative tricarboxylic transport membrane protein